MLGGRFGYFHTASTYHPHKIDDQHRECKTGGGAYFAFLLGSDNSHTTPPPLPKIPPDKEGLLWGLCVVRSPLYLLFIFSRRDEASKQVAGIVLLKIEEGPEGEGLSEVRRRW